MPCPAPLLAKEAAPAHQVSQFIPTPAVFHSKLALRWVYILGRPGVSEGLKADGSSHDGSLILISGKVPATDLSSVLSSLLHKSLFGALVCGGYLLGILFIVDERRLEHIGVPELRRLHLGAHGHAALGRL